MQNETDVERQAINIDILQEATELSVVKKIVALKGPKWKASPKLLDKSDSKTFHRLIRRNKHEPKDANSKVIRNENEEEVMNPEEQSRIFADYYEKLAVPSNEEHYEEDYLEESKYRLELMNNITKHQIDTCNITIFSEEEIIKAVNKLNSGKTADEYSLTAEHFIYAGGSISPNIVSLFLKQHNADRRNT
ncbi:unnamed protein product [Mytilus coruscus]|uniref:Uncharacterized protein n=1 Tax=Mytilus coruscus TaxID=42192 RepID=A0A6J8EYA2_MYTCO|nr:unnamed protein product [Mytilus coruscus]